MAEINLKSGEPFQTKKLIGQWKFNSGATGLELFEVLEISDLRWQVAATAVEPEAPEFDTYAPKPLIRKGSRFEIATTAG